MAIKDWSTTPASNSSAPPNGFPEGMLPSQVNDAARQVMADVRAWYEEPSWIDYGFTVAQASDTSFTVTGEDATAYFEADRRVKLVGGTTVYGVVTSSSFTTDTTVNVTLDSGVVPADLTSAQYSVVAPDAVTAGGGSVAWGGITGTLADQTDLQNALDAKEPTVALTASRAVVSDGSGALAASAVTSTEIGHLDGVTSGIQSQLNGKEPTLNADQKRKTTLSTAAPSGGADGDIWFQYTA